MKEQFEYFLNAIHYCLYLEEVWSNKEFVKIVNAFLSFTIMRFKHVRTRIYRRRERNKEALNEYMYGKKYGQSISVAHYLFGYFYSGYSIFLSFVLLGIPDGMFGGVSTTVAIAIIALPIGLCYIPAYKAVFSKDHYLKYFKQFEKEDEQWHKKWNRITWVFCIGSVVFTIGGIFAMWGVSLLFRK